MKYAKMTLAGFIEKLDGGQYAGAAGARRALGKATDFTNKDMDAARAAVEKAFPEDASGAPSAKPANRGRPAAVVAASPPERLGAAVSPVKRRGRPPKAVTAAVALPKPAARRGRPRTVKTIEPQASAAYSEVLHDQSGYSAPVAPPDFIVPQRGVSPGGRPQPVSASYYNSAAAIIAAYKGASPLTADERRAYDIAVQTSITQAPDEARALADAGERQSVVAPKKANGHAVEATKPGTPSRPHIPVGMAPPPSAIPDLAACADVDPSTVEPEYRDGVRKLNEARASIPELGPRLPMSVTS